MQERTETEGGIPLRSLDVVHKRSTSSARKREREEDNKRVFRGLALFLGEQPSLISAFLEQRRVASRSQVHVICRK